EEVRDNDYNLNIARYVDSSEEQESYDLYASMFGGIPSNELEKYSDYWNLFSGLKEKLFNKVNDNYYELKVEDVAETILHDSGVKQYIEDNKKILNDYSKYLYRELIQNMNVINISSEEEKISKELFDKLKNMNLIDKYRAYQELDDSWSYISQDLEVIHAEGFDSCTKVDPNMIIKKKDGKDIEVQDGWKGRIIPFALVQDTFLKELKTSIYDKNNRLDDISGYYSEIIDEISEDDKEILKDLLNDDNDAFKNSEVSKRAKVISKGKEDVLSEGLQQVVLKVDDLITEEKKLKNELKNDNTKLLEETKNKLESLNGDEIYDLLNKKWIIPTIDSINRITNDLISNFARIINTISEKYMVTLNDLESDINKTESELSGMIDSLTANEFDMKGLMEFKSLLEGDSNER
ncbi:type I restriction-modification system subunit M, partial [bacterium]|nr:type I restriction-modification system subunit M [bacterium]